MATEASIERIAFTTSRHLEYFTVSERVAIGQAIEERIGNRRGQRTDLEDEKKDDEELVQNFAQVEQGQKTRIEERIGNRRGQRTDLVTSDEAEEDQLVADLPQVDPRQKTRDVAAQSAGFGNPETYRQAKAVVVNGTPELIEAMDPHRRGERKEFAA